MLVHLCKNCPQLLRGSEYLGFYATIYFSVYAAVVSRVTLCCKFTYAVSLRHWDSISTGIANHLNTNILNLLLSNSCSLHFSLNHLRCPTLTSVKRICTNAFYQPWPLVLTTLSFLSVPKKSVLMACLMFQSVQISLAWGCLAFFLSVLNDKLKVLCDVVHVISINIDIDIVTLGILLGILPLFQCLSKCKSDTSTLLNESIYKYKRRRCWLWWGNRLYQGLRRFGNSFFSLPKCKVIFVR